MIGLPFLIIDSIPDKIDQLKMMVNQD